MIIEKIIRKGVFPKVQRSPIQLFLKIPYLKKKIKASVRQKVLDAFGGRFKLLAVDPVAQAVGLGRVDVRDRSVDLVTLRLFRREGQRFEDDFAFALTSCVKEDLHIVVWNSPI